MSVAPILALRKAIVAHLRADTTVTNTAVGQRIYGERTPAEPQWPFVRYGVSDAVGGFEVNVPLHIFSKADYTDDVNAIAQAIGDSLEGKALTLGDSRKAYLTWAGVRVMEDGAQAGAWHSIVTIAARIPRDCG